MASCKELKCVFKSCPFCSIKHSNLTRLAWTVWLSDIPLIITLKHQQWEIWGESYVNCCCCWNKVSDPAFTDKVSDPAFKRHAWVPTLPSCLPRLTELLTNILWPTVVALYSVSNGVFALHLLVYRKAHHADDSDVDDNEIKRTHHDLWSHIYNKQSYIRTSDDWLWGL